MSDVMLKGRSGVAGGVMLIGLGILLVSGWWWPGIMVVVGVALAADRWLAGRPRDAAVTLAIFLGIPLAISVFSRIDIPWVWVIALLFVGLGISSIVKAMSGSGRGDG